MQESVHTYLARRPVNAYFSTTPYSTTNTNTDERNNTNTATTEASQRARDDDAARHGSL